MPEDRTGILIIRAWIERRSSAPLRAHIRQTMDVSAGLHGGTTMTDERVVVDSVRAWLRDIRLDADPAPDTAARP